MKLEHGPCPGTIGRITEMHALYYAAEWGLDARFEAYVAKALSEFTLRYQPERDLLLRAVEDCRIVGTLTIDSANPDVPEDDATLRWFNVDSAVRGQGLGRQLMEAAMSFVERAEYRSVSLLTFKGLEAATALYRDFGFDLVEERSDDPVYGNPVVGQTFRWTRPDVS